MGEQSEMRPRLVYLPWPLVMEMADRMDEDGYTTLACEARGRVWNEAARLYMLDRATAASGSRPACPSCGEPWDHADYDECICGWKRHAVASTTPPASGRPQEGTNG